MTHHDNIRNSFLPKMISPFQLDRFRCLAGFALLVLLIQQPISAAPAQQTDDQAQQTGSGEQQLGAQAKQSSASGAKERYEQALQRGRELAKECRNVSLNFYNTTLAKSYQWKEKWPEVSKKLADHRTELEQAAIDWFFECEKPPKELLGLAAAISSSYYDAGDFEMAWRLLEKFEKFYPGRKDIMLQRRIALVGLKTNRYDRAVEFLQNPEAKEAIEELEDPVDKNMLFLSPLLAKKWQREQALREKEAEADDLPRVKIQLSTGEVVVELFENEAPQTVANFLSLVESGYFDSAVFHPVVKNLVAQTGMYRRSKTVQLDKYLIKNESRLPDARKHFAGSLTMASYVDGELSMPTVFAVMLLANTELDWDGTDDDKVSQPVFGRVVSGMNHLMALPGTVEFDTETDTEKPIKGVVPGYIKKATVIRKRDHDYKFEKIESQSEREKKTDPGGSSS